jgi:hypothetical protein
VWCVHEVLAKKMKERKDEQEKVKQKSFALPAFNHPTTTPPIDPALSHLESPMGMTLVTAPSPLTLLLPLLRPQSKMW